MTNDSIIAEAARRMLADLCEPQAVNRASDDSWMAPAWHALENLGLTRTWVPEELNGAGADVAEGFAVLRETGRAAVSLPVAETLLAGWLLSQAGITPPSGVLTCGPARVGDQVVLAGSGTLSGRLRAVPFAKGAEHLAVLAEREAGGTGVVALVKAGDAEIADGASLAGDPLNTVVLNGVRPVEVADATPALDGNALLLMGAAVRAMQMAGALEAILDIAVAYANERVAFGKPIGKFQAVQHNLARLAGEVAAALAAAGSAAEVIATASAFDEGVLLEAASAKIRVGEAATEGAGIAHQVLGAIGFTKEHVLHRYTQRLWAWRDDFGSESQWAVRLGQLVATKGADALWPMLAAR
jgi:acyl-CoA dehydrogenase